MVKLLEANEVDTENEAVDAVLTEAEEGIARRKFARTEQPGDLSDGGMVNGAMLRPMQADGRLAERGKATQGRPAARRAWMWDGTETVLPLAYQPDGKSHDGARRYLLKRHCLCCNYGGFRGVQCPNCVKNQCNRCGASTVRAKIIPCFYLRQEDVPYPAKFYGSIPCFLSFCIRQGDRGFKTQEEMRMHARSRHRMEYQAYMETLAATRVDEITALRAQVDALMRGQMQTQPVATVATKAALRAARAPGKKWSPERRKAASIAAKKRIAAGSAV